jgi:hypothetical protein
MVLLLYQIGTVCRQGEALQFIPRPWHCFVSFNDLQQLAPSTVAAHTQALDTRTPSLHQQV